MTAPAPSKLPVVTVRSGTLLHRVHGDGRAARWYGRKDATWRWDDPNGDFGVLYLGRSSEGPFAEALLRSPADRDVLWSRVQQKRQARFRTLEPLRLAKLHGEGLAWWEVTAAEIAEADYAVPQGLSLKINAVVPVDGIQYRSRFDNDALCIALFDRADNKIDLVGEGESIDKTWAHRVLSSRGYRLIDL